MGDEGFVLGLLGSTLGPAVLAAWLIRRWVRKVLRTALIVALIGGAAWVGGGAVLSDTLSGLEVATD